MLNRRGFLSGLIGAATAMTLDPEKALWVPAKKLISIPAPRPKRLYLTLARWPDVLGPYGYTSNLGPCDELRVYGPIDSHGPANTDWPARIFRVDKATADRHNPTRNRAPSPYCAGDVLVLPEGDLKIDEAICIISRFAEVPKGKLSKAV